MVSREGAIHRRYFRSKPSPDCDEKIETDIDCHNPDLLMLGMFHTHPEDDGASARPSGKDIETAMEGACGRQLYIVSSSNIYFYAPDGTSRPVSNPKLPRGESCPSQLLPDDDR